MAGYLSNADLAAIREAEATTFATFCKACTVAYPPISVVCTNCASDTIGNKPGFTYQHGGPIPFTVGPCPVCDGAGEKSSVTTESVDLVVEFNPRDSKVFADTIANPNSVIRVQAKMDDLPKLLNAQYLTVPNISGRFAMFRNAGDEQAIIQGAYCISYWKASG